MMSICSSHEDFLSLTVSEDSTVSEGTRRLLSPYNRNRFSALNRDINMELSKVKDMFRSITIDLNSFNGQPDQLKDFKEKIRHINRILLAVKQRKDILDDKNEQMLLDLQNHVWEIAKYSVRIEIYLCTLERLKNSANELLQMTKRYYQTPDSNEKYYNDILELGKRLKDETKLIESRARIDCQNVILHENLEKIQRRCSIIMNSSERQKLKSLRNFHVKKATLNHCRNRLLD
ncbi:unnamed protein product [Didymodactylos carnosus]|uniref:Uncharacterized protein n=1 Tax=Didymodactylos carnosus TaxID=1234261 RepID=A0A813NJ75_9BILA|nr:unnamed protein product [Didymodactylos carnosus]CAF1061925.1 unnamed protein product [Didymodactylos carnosus]CAF3517697.1 unnamed protein product [Didymodactylos carnosus]CAF3827378.1 unnamed protein product [Didymodactylos carnosus]